MDYYKLLRNFKRLPSDAELKPHIESKLWSPLKQEYLGNKNSTEKIQRKLIIHTVKTDLEKKSMYDQYGKDTVCQRWIWEDKRLSGKSLRRNRTFTYSASSSGGNPFEGLIQVVTAVLWYIRAVRVKRVWWFRKNLTTASWGIWPGINFWWGGA